MIKTRHSHKKPDFLAVLVIQVSVGVLVSATLKARDEGTAEPAVITAQLEKAADLTLQSR